MLFYIPSFCNGSERELECKTDIEKQHFIIYRPLVFILFSSNISCNPKHNVRLCSTIQETEPFFSSERSTQQANNYTKQTVTNRIPVTATLIRVNEASVCNSSTSHLECSGMATCRK